MTDSRESEVADGQPKLQHDACNMQQTLNETTGACVDSTDTSAQENAADEGSDIIAGLSSMASGWLSGWGNTLSTAKNKSAEVLDMVKKDINELSQAVHSETSNIISSTSQAVRSQLNMEHEESTVSHITKSMSDFFSHVHEVFTPDTVDDDDTEAYVMKDGKTVRMDQLQADLYNLTTTAATFTTDPTSCAPRGDPAPQAHPPRQQDFAGWCSTVDLEARQPELSEQLACSSQLLSMYTQLVPATISHSQFWLRYLYRVHLAEQREKQREERRQRAEKMSRSAGEASIDWDQEDLSGHISVTDTQTNQLLTDYDKEQHTAHSQTLSDKAERVCESPGKGSSNENETDDDWVRADTASSSNFDSTDWEKCVE